MLQQHFEQLRVCPASKDGPAQLAGSSSPLLQVGSWLKSKQQLQMHAAAAVHPRQNTCQAWGSPARWGSALAHRPVRAQPIIV